MADELIPSEFLLELFRLTLHDLHIQQICISKLKANWLPLQEEKDFLTELRYQIETEKKKPSFGTLLIAARAAKNKGLFDYISLVRETKLADTNSVMKSMEDFIRQAMFIEMYDRSAQYFNSNKKKQAYSEFLKGAEQLNQFSLTQDLFEPVFKNFPLRNANRIIDYGQHSDLMPCGIDGIDDIFGGFQRKEYVLIMAGSKGTKSFAMVHMGVNYARRGYPVLHFQIEGTKKQCMARYDSAWLGSTYTDVRAGEIGEAKFKSYQKIVDNIGRGEIYVYAPESYDTMTMLDIRAMVIDFKKKHDIAVVIIDYLDLVPPSGEHFGIHDERLKKQRTSRAMKALAMDTDTLVISNTQSSSVESELLDDPDFVLKRENTSEDKGTVQAVDYLFTLNRTRDERKEKLLRIFIDAAREHMGDQIITIRQNLARSRFYDRKATVAAGLWDA